jgi:hypothetical protein
MNIQRRKEISGYAPGDLCTIFRLKNSPQYNGVNGIIGRFFEDSGRYEVKLGAPFNKSVKVRVSNLEAVYTLPEPGQNPTLINIVNQLKILREEALIAYQQRRNGAHTECLRHFCNLIEENQERFEGLKSDCYWSMKIDLLRLEFNLGRLDFDEYKANCFEVMDEANCPQLQIEALTVWNQYIALHNCPTAEYAYAIEMLEQRLDAHYGWLGAIICCLVFLISDKFNDHERACLLLEEYIPVCESLPIKDRKFKLRMNYASTFSMLLNSRKEDPHMTMGKLQEMITKGNQLIEEMNNAWAQRTPTLETESPNLEKRKFKTEAEMIVAIAMAQSPMNLGEIERALSLHVQVAKMQLRMHGEQSDAMMGFYWHICHCCVLLGDAKNAKKFWRKATKNRNADLMTDTEKKAMTQNIKNMQHTRDLSIVLEKEIRCDRPECDNIGGTKLCTRCESVRYCSRKCQRAHWKKHKKQCKKHTSPFK